MIAWRDTRARLRGALVETVLGTPSTLPDPRRVDLGGFWARFDAAAPVHLRLGFDVATVVLGAVLPTALGHGGPLTGLDAAARDTYIQRVAAWPGCRDLLQIVKVVAALGYFDDDAVEDAARRVAP